jgi:polyisoprenoid-binding protein YceI
MDARDKELRGAGFFNVASFPAARYVASGLVRLDATHARVDGQLTLLGLTRPVPMEVTLIGVGTGLANDKRIGVIGHMQIKRSDFGMKAFLPFVGMMSQSTLMLNSRRKTDRWKCLFLVIALSPLSCTGRLPPC